MTRSETTSFGQPKWAHSGLPIVGPLAAILATDFGIWKRCRVSAPCTQCMKVKGYSQQR